MAVFKNSLTFLKFASLYFEGMCFIVYFPVGLIKKDVNESHHQKIIDVILPHSLKLLYDVSNIRKDHTDVYPVAVINKSIFLIHFNCSRTFLFTTLNVRLLQMYFFILNMQLLLAVR